MAEELELLNGYDQIRLLLDDGQLTEDERLLLQRMIEHPQPAFDADLAKIVNDLRRALAAPPLGAERTPTDPILINSIVSRLQQQLHLDTVRNGTLETRGPQANEPKPHLIAAEIATPQIGSYQILRLMGRGGMGAVYEAIDPVLHRHIALKVILPFLSAKEQARVRFLREARAAARVEHDNICPIYQVGEENGVAFIAMPLLVGESLETCMRRGRFSVERVLDVVLQIAKGLDAAHQAGLIHRDIKPANIWIEDRKNDVERIRLLDFGLAQIDSEEADLTQSGTILGTPSYMSPEQAQGNIVDVRSDLFSVGAVVYELLTGQKAFPGKNTTSILSNILTVTPPAPESIDGSCPKPLSQLVMKLLEKAPGNRLSSASELISAIAKIRALDSTSEPTKIVEPLTPTLVDGTTAKLPQSKAPRTPFQFDSGWKWPLIATASLGAFCLAGVIYFQTSSGTLVVQTTDEAEARFKNGELQILDDAGKIQYRLTAEAPTQELHPGSYHVRVVGADGLQLSTDQFSIHRNSETVIRVTATGARPETEAVLPNNAPVPSIARSFHGKALVAIESFQVDSLPFPLTENSRTKSYVKDRQFVFERLVTDPADPFITIPVGAKLSRQALSVQLRAKNSSPFVNFCTRGDGQKARWLSLSFQNGVWYLTINRQGMEDGKWVPQPVTQLAKADLSDMNLTGDHWIDVACRWSEKDYDVWVNGEYIAGGSLPSDELTIGRPQETQICSKAIGSNASSLELKRLYLWDQTAISLEEANK